MKLLLSLFLSTSCLFIHAQQLAKADSTDIMAVFDMQEKAWNEGDIPAFMEGYWKSEQLVFTGSNGPVYGWQNTFERYKKSYPDRTIMGTLSFDIVNMRAVTDEVALVIGKFYLKRDIEDASGYFTLVWQKFNGKWLIISDHTS
ncbi:MAG: nuclear transport factor 2 family protein [Bacteroidota bacterium]